MAMDSSNYVSQSPGGGYRVIINGQMVADGMSQSDAENLFNTKRGNTNTPDFDWAGLGRARAAGNQQDFDEKVREFNAWLDFYGKQLGLDQAKLDELKRQFDKKLYSDMAQSLLGASVQLASKPENWLDYAQYTSGGKDIFKQSFGNQPAPAFGVSGYSEPNNVVNILKDLGITMAPGGDAGSDQQALDWIWQNRPDLAQFYKSNGWDVSTPDKQRLAVQNWISQGDPQWKGMNATQVAQKLGYKPPVELPGQGVTPMPMPRLDIGNNPPGTTGSNQPPDNSGGREPMPEPKPPGGGGYPVTDKVNPYMAPLPYQFNPAVWDSMSDTAKRMILASASRGNTSSGVWTPEDYVSQLNAARPKGNAPRRINFDWGNQGSYF